MRAARQSEPEVAGEGSTKREREREREIQNNELQINCSRRYRDAVELCALPLAAQSSTISDQSCESFEKIMISYVFMMQLPS